MGEEGTNLRLVNIEENVKELKENDKEQTLKMVEMEKSNIRIEINLKKILETYTTIKNTAIGFFVLNILGMLWFGSQK